MPKATDSAGITDSYVIEMNGEPDVKGPDPAVWGEPEPAADPELDPNVKGPDPAVWPGNE